MARIRMIKPEFFDDPDIGDLSPLARLFFIGLWTQADKEGRLPEDLRRLKARIFPYDTVDLQTLMDELRAKLMIRTYIDSRSDAAVIWICNFAKHQRPHPKEPPSVIGPCKAVKKHGRPGKNTARRGAHRLRREKVMSSREKDRPNPSESGSLDLGSLESGEEQDQEQCADAHNFRVLLKLAYGVLAQLNREAELPPISELSHRLGDEAVRYDIPYANNRELTKVMDSAVSQWRRAS